MRTLVQPPPSLRCEFCRGELRFKLIESGEQTFDLDIEVFVCVSCGREKTFTVGHDRYRPRPKVA